MSTLCVIHEPERLIKVRFLFVFLLLTRLGRYRFPGRDRGLLTILDGGHETKRDRNLRA